MALKLHLKMFGGKFVKLTENKMQNGMSLDEVGDPLWEQQLGKHYSTKGNCIWNLRQQIMRKFIKYSNYE